MNLKVLYQEIILEHGKNPRNLGKVHEFNKDAKGNNPLKAVPKKERKKEAKDEAPKEGEKKADAPKEAPKQEEKK